MDVTIRNVDEHAFRLLKAYAAYHDITLGEALSRLIERHISVPWEGDRAGNCA